MEKTPVFVISGFLGSGKTTLLQRLLNECASRKLTTAVLMNEVGKTDTDGNTISGKSKIIEKLLDGCICCNKKSEVVKSMEKLLTLKPDVIFIELTGVANPEEVVDSLTEPALINKVYLKKVITLIDAENILSYNSLIESDRELVRTTRRQIEVSDLLIVNKIDLVTDKSNQKINKLLVKHNSGAKIIQTTYSNIELTSLFDFKKESSLKTVKIKIKGLRTEQNDHKHDQSYSRVNSITLPVSTTVNAREIESFLKKWKANLIRAKGYLLLRDGTYLMQHVMKRVSWERTTYNGDHYLVLIGIELNEGKVRKEWKQVNLKASAL